MKSRYFRDRNLRLYSKFNEIKVNTLRSLLEDKVLSPSIRHKIFIKLTNKYQWASLNKSSNRCMITNRGRGVFRLTKMSRHQFRKMASQGLLPGVRASS